MSTWWGDSKNMEEIEFSRWLFEGRPRQGKNVLPDGLNWLCYFAGSSKSHHENSISFIFLEFPRSSGRHEKSSKHFFGYFNTLETHSGPCPLPVLDTSLNLLLTRGEDYAHNITTGPPDFWTVGRLWIIIEQQNYSSTFKNDFIPLAETINSA